MLDDAVDRLGQASALDRTDPDLANDLGVAQFARGLRRGSAEDFFLGLAHILRARRLAPASEAAELNQALILNQSPTATSHDPTWDRLANSGDRGLQHLARFHQESASKPDLHSRPSAIAKALNEATRGDDQHTVEALARDRPDATRRYVEFEAWTLWATALQADDSMAGPLWRTLVTVGRALEQHHGDPSIRLRLQQIERALALGEASKATVAQAVRAYGEASALFRGGRFADAHQRFEDTQWLNSLGGAWRGWRRFRGAQVFSVTFDAASTLDRLLAAVQTAERVRDPILLATSLARVSHIRLTLGESDHALAASRRSHALFRRHRASMQAARTAALHALALEHRGQLSEAWTWLWQGLEDLGNRHDFDARSLLMAAGSHFASVADEPDLALFFHDQYLTLARGTGRADIIADALRGRARLQHDLGLGPSARADLDAARLWWRKIDSDTMRDAVDAELSLVEAVVHRDADPNRAHQAITKAVAKARSTDYPYVLAGALRIESDVLLALGRPHDAEQSLASALDEVERQRLTIRQPADRVAYLDQRRALLDAMVSLQLDHLDRPARARAYSDRARANALRDWMSEPPEPRSLPVKLRPRTDATHAPPGTTDRMVTTTTLTYAVLEERTIVWVEQSSRKDIHLDLPVGRRVLEATVDRWISSLRDGRETAVALAEQLHAWLLAPLPLPLGGAPSRLVIVPDGALHRIPFGLLRAAETNRAILQDHAVIMAPSNLDARRWTLRTARDAPASPWVEAPLLMVSAPTLGDRGEPRLRADPMEGLVASRFPSRTWLRAEGATKTAFLTQAPHHEMLYFGGHSVVDRAAPMRSYMLFASSSAEPDDHGRLYANEVLEMDLRATRLVILASCETAGGHLAQTEGVESLARPFLAAGAATVVAALWPVEDTATGHVFSHFFRMLADGAPPWAALRDTQRALVRDRPDEIETWGAFVLISR